MRMAQDEATRGQHVVDVLPAAHVVDLRALPVLNDEGRLVRIAGGAEHAPGQPLLRALEQGGFFGGSCVRRFSHGGPRVGERKVSRATTLSAAGRLPVKTRAVRHRPLCYT